MSIISYINKDDERKSLLTTDPDFRASILRAQGCYCIAIEYGDKY